jgi:2'-5' RNA ligase
MRLFIGLDLPYAIKEKLNSVSLYLVSLMKDKELPLIDNYHITLEFIGESLEPDYYIEVLKMLSIKPFKVKITDLSAFDKKNRKVIHFRVESDELYDLQKDVYFKLHGTSNESYTPHITLIRNAFYKDPLPILTLDEEIEINHIELFESKRVDGILKYEVIYSHKLKEIR